MPDTTRPPSGRPTHPSLTVALTGLDGTSVAVEDGGGDMVIVRFGDLTARITLFGRLDVILGLLHDAVAAVEAIRAERR